MIGKSKTNKTGYDDFLYWQAVRNSLKTVMQKPVAEECEMTFANDNDHTMLSIKKEGQWEVVSIADGMIVSFGKLDNGNAIVEIEHLGGVFSKYEISIYSTTLSEGKSVKQGEKIGFMKDTMNFSIIVNPNSIWEV